MPKLIVLGNCVAERLALLLEGLLKDQARCCPSLKDNWEVVTIPPINMLPVEVENVAHKAMECDCIFSQPLFNFGPCNTSILRQKLGDKLHLFSAPNFEAYFPDVMDIRPYPENVNYDPPLEWHSKIIIKAKAAGIDPQEMDKLYPNHSLFKTRSIQQAIERSIDIYIRRDKDVEIGSLDFVKDHYASEPLFYTWNHPGESLLKHLLEGMLKILGLNTPQSAYAMKYIPWARNLDNGWNGWGFGFNEWPIITASHDFFHFPSREYFRILGKKQSISEATKKWYKFYDDHPHIFEKALSTALV